jgi:hypothetical protein
MTEHWGELKRANWDVFGAPHLDPGGDHLASLHAARGVLKATEDAELGPVAGLRVLHLHCHSACRASIFRPGFHDLGHDQLGA